MMNRRLQFSPIFGTQQPQQDPAANLPLRERWEGPAAKWENAEVFRSWLVYDSDLEAEHSSSKGHFNWNAVLGLALAVAVSVTFWVGVVLMVANR
jgi:hypothetical protein